MKLLTGVLLIILSLIHMDINFLSIITGLSLIPLVIKRKGVGLSIILLSFLPVVVLPTEYKMLLPNSLKLLLRFQGFYMIASWTGNYVSEKLTLPLAKKTPLGYSLLLALNIFPHISQFVKDSFNQMRLRKRWVRFFPGYLSFLLLYLSHYADELGYEIERVLSREEK